MTEEEFTDGAGIPRGGVHADAEHSWSLKYASLSAIRRGGPRPAPRPWPSPRPSPQRPADDVVHVASRS
jgi:hypothetical protein